MNKINRRRVLTISLSWMCLGAFLTLIDHLTLISHFSKGPDASSYDLVSRFVFHMSSGFTGGFVGSFVLILVTDRFRSEPYYKSLVIIVVFFVLITGSITTITSAIPAFVQHPFYTVEWQQVFLQNLLTTFHLKNILFWAGIVALTYFFIQMSNKFGPGNLLKVITGTYNIPKTENRVFMFLDLKSSTSIAEGLGSFQYHRFLKQVFADITDAIMKSEGDIYQYVGDEIVISWPTNKTSLEKVIQCFFDTNDALFSLKERYQQSYGAIPVFKAGVHGGEVIAGEIGIIKRDITYSGDVLNTAARIQSMCNELNSRLLISRTLLDKVTEREQWLFESQGAIELKGKHERLELLSVKKKLG